MLNCLVTGGAGFIGSHLVEDMLRAGARVTVVDNFDPFYPSAYKRSNLVRASQYSTFRLAEADICSIDALRELAGPYDCIVHLAAKAGVRPSISDPIAYQHVNVTGTQNMLEVAREWRVPQFVFASSSSVYGINTNTPWRESDHVLLPISPYASTKVTGELLGHVYSHLYGIRFIALRFFTVYGPRQRPDLAIRKFAELILAGQPIRLFGDGSTTRDYTYIDDIVDGIRAAVECRGAVYETVNLGNGRPVTLLETIGTIEDALNTKAILEFLPPQPGDVPTTCADISKARTLLGYDPRIRFPEGIARFAEWFKSNSAAGQPGSKQSTKIAVGTGLQVRGPSGVVPRESASAAAVYA